MKIVADLFKTQHLGLLLIRIGLGITFILHGWPKISGGTEYWAKVGGAMVNFGITFAPVFWGFMASATEFGGGILLLLGLFFRPVSFLLFITMVVATFSHIGKGDAFNGYSHALEMAIVFLGLFFIGPGRYSLDAKIQKPRPLPFN